MKQHRQGLAAAISLLLSLAAGNTALAQKQGGILLMEKASDKLRFNPRKSIYKNLDRVTARGGDEATFHLKRPQPGFLNLLAGGFSAIYPCHVPPAQMRQHPIGTGPFKFVEFKPN